MYIVIKILDLIVAKLLKFLKIRKIIYTRIKKKNNKCTLKKSIFFCKTMQF